MHQNRSGIVLNNTRGGRPKERLKNHLSVVCESAWKNDPPSTKLRGGECQAYKENVDGGNDQKDPISNPRQEVDTPLSTASGLFLNPRVS